MTHTALHTHLHACLRDYLHDYRQVWRVTALQRQFASDNLMRWTALLLACAGLFAAILEVSKNGVGPLLLPRMLAGVGGTWMAIAYVVLFIPVSIEMNSTANACLMPRQRRRLMQVAAAGWLLTTSSLAFAIGAWMALPLTGLFLLSFALERTGRPHLLVAAALAGNWPWLSRGVLPQGLVDALESPAGVLALVLALLAVAARSLLQIYPAGGDAHRSRDLRLAGQAAAAGSEDAWTQVQHDRMSLWSGRATYAAALRLDSRARVPDALLMHASGPAMHWSIWIGSALFMLAIAVATRLVLHWTAGGQGHRLALGIAALGIVVLVASVVFSTAQHAEVLRRTRREQALVRLTPLAGDAGLLNRRLGRALLRRFLAGWAVLTAAILAATAIVDAGFDGLPRQFALCCLAGQVAATGLLGDHARSGVWTLRLGFAAAALAALDGAAAMGLGLLAMTPPWPWLAALSLGGATLVLRRGWRRMVSAPPAFPVGRFE